MSELNSNNNEVEQKEKKNSIKEKESLESKLIKGFIWSKVKWIKNRKNKVNFVNDIMSANIITSAMKKELQNYGNEYSEFDELDYDKININKLQRETRTTFIEIVNKKERLKEIFLKDYDLTQKNYDSFLKKRIDKLEEDDLKKLGDSQKLRKTFIEDIYWKNKIPKTRDFLKSLKNLDFSKRIESKLKKIEWEEYDDLVDLANRFSLEKKLDAIDIVTLFEIGFFTMEEKKDIVKTFLPNIDLRKAKELWIITQTQLEQYKYNYVKYNFFDNKNISNQDIIFIANKLNNEDIKVSIEKILSNDSYFDIIIKDSNLWYKIGQNIFQDVEKGVKEKEILQEKKDVEKTWKDLKWFQKQLSKHQVVVNPEKFQDGNVIIIDTYEVVEWEWWKNNIETTFYWDIKNAWDKTAKVDLINKGQDVYNSSSDLFSRNYKTILDFVEKWNIKTWIKVKQFEIITKDELRKKIDSGQLKENVNELELKDSDYNKNEKTRLKKELLERKKELLSKWVKEDKLKEDSKYWVLLKEFDELDEYNLRYLEKTINEEVDPDWKDFWIKDNVVFNTKDWEVFSIHHINPITNEIIVWSAINWKAETPISFQTFFKLFKEKECKRKSIATNFWELFDSVSWKLDWWKNFKLKWNKIQKEKTEHNISYDYLVSKEGEEVIRIDDILWWNVRITPWFYKEKNKKDEKTWKSKWKKKIYSMDKNSFMISVWALEYFIKKKWLIPRSIDEEKDIKNDNIKSPKQHGSFWSKLFDQHFSVWELISWWKLWIESIENYLKEWNEEHAAMFASSTLWKFLPDELKKDLKTRVETAWKKRMDDYVQKLRDVDSYVATGMIEDRLLNKNTPQQKLEAAALFMMEKYGTLFAKWPLYKYKGGMLWYKAFGWVVDDVLYKQQQKEHEDFWVNFIEDHLVFMLIKKQCWKDWYTNEISWKNIKRRTRLHKEYKAVRNKAKEEEWAKGKEDAGSHRNIWARLRYAMWELESWTYPNAIWALESIFWKWWDYTIINALPIIMSFSWIAYEMDQEVLDKLKNRILWTWKMLPISGLLSYTAHIDTLNNTILELSKDLEELQPDCAWMSKMAKEIFSHIWDKNHNWKEDFSSLAQWNEKVKIKKTVEFYDKYWEYLTWALNQLNTWEHKTAKTNKILQLKKDEPWKQIYGEYLSLFWEMVDQLWTYTDEGAMMTAVPGLWTSWIDVYKATKEVLYQDQWWGFRNKKIWPMMWKEIYTQMDAIIRWDIVYVEWNLEADKKAKAKILKNMLRWLLWWFLEAHWTRNVIFFSLNKPTSPFGSRFNRWWIKTKEIASYKISSERMLDETDVDANNLLDKYVKNMLEWIDCTWIAVNDIIQETENKVDLISSDNKIADDYEEKKAA